MYMWTIQLDTLGLNMFTCDIKRLLSQMVVLKRIPIGVFTNAQNWQYCQIGFPTYLKVPSLFATHGVSTYGSRHQ